MQKRLPLALTLVVAASGLSAAEPAKRDMVLYRHEARYSAFPSLTRGLGDQLWVSFGWNTTRSHYGKAAGGQTGGISLFSPDGGETRLKEGLSGDHAWYLNSGPGQSGDYPNGSIAPGRETDLAFKVYAEAGPLPRE